ncbi:MAG: CatB-related O-acetyltransferase [Roseburia sp.]|nr:CatB-related O-acetyltransferase [Roseburia sp.]
MTTIICQIKAFIEEKLNKGYRKFIIFPYGDVGIQVKQILNTVYGLQEAYILDNHLWKYNPQIKALDFLKDTECGDCCLLLSSTNPDLYEELKKEAQKYFPEENIAELSSMQETKKEAQEPEYITQIGKYSYGPICVNHPFIESIGAFCSFALGTDVVFNHEINYLTTHPMIYEGSNLPIYRSPEYYSNVPYYFEGMRPKREKLKIAKRCRIGNDVWLGRNTLVTNYANIGNGVIAGAGTIITKDVPDYAVVVGAPARILRYRYSPEEIAALNKIAWWDWSDDEIRARYDDLYLPVAEFIDKYL